MGLDEASAVGLNEASAMELARSSAFLTVPARAMPPPQLSFAPCLLWRRRAFPRLPMAPRFASSGSLSAQQTRDRRVASRYGQNAERTKTILRLCRPGTDWSTGHSTIANTGHRCSPQPSPVRVAGLQMHTHTPIIFRQAVRCTRRFKSADVATLPKTCRAL